MPDIDERNLMAARLRGRIVATAVTAPLFIVLAGCGGSSSGGDKDAGENPPATCPSGLDQPAATQPPSDVPTPEGADSAYEYFPQGATKVWNYSLDETPDDLATLRDSYDDALKSKGYEIEGTDQEEGHEAESEFKGAHEGTTNFRVLCDGKVVFRLKLTS